MSETLFLAAVFVLGILSGGTAAVVGFGIGSLLTPLLLTWFPPNTAVTVVALPHRIATSVRFVQHRADLDRGVLLRFGIPSAIGGVAGALLQRTLGGPLLVMVLAVLLISTGLASITHGFGRWHPGPKTAAVLGLLSGIFGGLAGNQGGLRAAGLTAFNLTPRAYLATGTAVALMIDLARTPIYLAAIGTARSTSILPPRGSEHGTRHRRDEKPLPCRMERHEEHFSPVPERPVTGVAEILRDKVFRTTRFAEIPIATLLLLSFVTVAIGLVCFARGWPVQATVRGGAAFALVQLLFLGVYWWALQATELLVSLASKLGRWVQTRVASPAAV